MGALADMIAIERLAREQDRHLSDAAQLRGLLVRIGAVADDADEVRRLVSCGLTGIDPRATESEGEGPK